MQPSIRVALLLQPQSNLFFLPFPSVAEFALPLGFLSDAPFFRNAGWLGEQLILTLFQSAHPRKFLRLNGLQVVAVERVAVAGTPVRVYPLRADS